MAGQTKPEDYLAFLQQLDQAGQPYFLEGGQLGVFTLDGEPPLLVDLMSGVYGIPPRNNARLAQRALIIDGVRVIDPPHLFKSKCCCLMDLDQTGRQDERHLRILCHILPIYFLELLRAAQEGEIAERALIREVKLMAKISSFQRCHRALERIEVPADSLVPVKELESSGLPVLERFVKTSLSGGADLPPS